MKNKPWIAVDLFTGQVLGNYASDVEAIMAWPGRAVDVQWAPRCREVK